MTTYDDLPFESDDEAAERELRERFSRRHQARHNKPSASARRRERRQREQWEYEGEMAADRAAMMHEYHPLTGSLESEAAAAYDAMYGPWIPMTEREFDFDRWTAERGLA